MKRPGIDEPDERELKEIARHPISRKLELEFIELWRRNRGCDPINVPVKVWPKGEEA